MSKKPLYYLDTNIYLNFFYEENKTNIVAYKLFQRSLSCEFRILISTWVLIELKKKIPNNEISYLMLLLKPKIVRSKYTFKDVKKAKKLNPNHFQDALHVLIAKKYRANAIITRDKDLKKSYSKLINIKFPEDF